MKKKLVAILIANVIFISNVAFAPFVSDAVFNATDNLAQENTVTEESKEEIDEETDEETESSSSSDEPEYVKISKFEELPEEITYQEVKAGTPIEEIIFPDTLKIDVVADTDRDERIARKLGEERAARKRDKELDAAEASSELSSLEEDESSLEDSLEPDEEEIIFFDSETGEISTGRIDEEEQSDYSNEGSGEESIGDTYQPYVVEPEPAKNESTGNESTGNENTENKDTENVNEEIQDTGSEESAPVNEETEEPAPEEEQGTEGLIGKIENALRMSRVYALNEDEDTAVDTAEDTAEDTVVADDSESDEEISHEMVSGIQWILNPVTNGTDVYNPDMVGMEYVFTPILLIPDFYYIEAELPTITVKIIEDEFAFDKSVEVDGVKIRVRADKGVFPEDAYIKADKLDDEKAEEVNEALSEQIESEDIVVKSYSFDIQILDKDDKEIEPDTEKGRVIVSFEAQEAKDESLKADIFHVLDGNNNEETNNEEDNSEADVLGVKRDQSETDSSSEGIVIERLTAVVVGEDTKVVEAVTDGFSTYVLRFSTSTDLTYDVKEAFVSLDELLEKLQIATTGDGKSIDTASVDSTLNNYIYVKPLEFETDASTNKIVPKPNSYGLFTQDTSSGKWFLVVQKPKMNETPINAAVNITYGGNPYVISLNITDITAETVDFENGAYPTGIELGTNSFKLKMPVRINSESPNPGAVSYQWESSATNSDSSFTPIEYANTEVYGANSSAAVGKWYRCLINGKPSNAVQVITQSTDSIRDWEGINTSADQCYISNGTMAYTLNSTSTTEGRTVQTFDVIGDFDDDMLATTASGNGWKVLSTTAESPSETHFGAGASLKELYFRFDESDPSLLYGTAQLLDGYRSFAFGEGVAVGNTTVAASALNGTLYANKNSGSIDCVSYMAVDSLNTAATKMKSKTDALQYPAYAVLPVTTAGLKVWMGFQGSNHPLAYVGSEGNLLEGMPSALGMSWVGVPSGSSVEFAFSVDSLWDIYTLEKHKKTSNSSYYKPSELSTSVKGVSLNSDGKSKLQYYAESVGTPYDDVAVNMSFNSAPLSDSVIEEFKSKKTFTKDLKDSTGTGSNAAYCADILEISVDQTVTTNGTANKSNVPEVIDNNKKAVLLAFEISYDFNDKKNITLLREHDGTVSTMSTSGTGERYTLDKSNGKITVYAYKFSTYAIAYQSSTQYYTVTFDDGTTKSTVKVKSGEKVSRPADPSKEGYTFKGWYLKGTTSTSTSTSTSTKSSTSTSSSGSSNATAYNFDSPVTKDITLVAGWTSDKDVNGASKGAESDNDSRAPQTRDSLPIVWLWVLILVAGMITFVISMRELSEGGNEDSRKKKPGKFKRALLLIAIVISTTIKFLMRKIRENRAAVLSCISAVVVVVSAIVLISTRYQYKVVEDLYIDAEETYIEESPSVAGVKKPREEKGGWWDCVNVNLPELTRKYPDVVGWIYFENEDISYPILYSGDNSKYLSTTYTGEKAKAGAIFIDGESTPDFSDPHSLVYGHNMRDMSMFGKLRYYTTKPDYYNEHQYFQIFTKDSVYRYQIFACEEVPDSHDVFWVYGKRPSNYWKMLKEVERDSLIDTGIKANESDHVITLATCTADENKRLIICGVRTDAYNYEQ